MARLSGCLSPKATKPVLAGVIALCGASCSSDYLARRDTLSAGSGDAVRANIAVQVADPRPASANRVGGTTDGEFLQHVIERYENPGAGSSGLAQPAAAGVPATR